MSGLPLEQYPQSLPMKPGKSVLWETRVQGEALYPSGNSSADIMATEAWKLLNRWRSITTPWTMRRRTLATVQLPRKQSPRGTFFIQLEIPNSLPDHNFIPTLILQRQLGCTWIQKADSAWLKLESLLATWHWYHINYGQVYIEIYILYREWGSLVLPWCWGRYVKSFDSLVCPSDVLFNLNITFVASRMFWSLNGGVRKTIATCLCTSVGLNSPYDSHPVSRW